MTVAAFVRVAMAFASSATLIMSTKTNRPTGERRRNNPHLHHDLGYAIKDLDLSEYEPVDTYLLLLDPDDDSDDVWVLAEKRVVVDPLDAR